VVALRCWMWRRCRFYGSARRRIHRVSVCSICWLYFGAWPSSLTCCDTHSRLRHT